MQMHRVVHKKSQPSHASNASAMLMPLEPKKGGGGALYVGMGFYADISWESIWIIANKTKTETRCNIEINV